ncbi:MAG: site-specific integrase [Dehalococcoidia bacterium]|nr:site-specific integrase [Dehalococcoidia bacterium]
MVNLWLAVGRPQRQRELGQPPRDRHGRDFKASGGQLAGDSFNPKPLRRQGLNQLIGSVFSRASARGTKTPFCWRVVYGTGDVLARYDCGRAGGRVFAVGENFGGKLSVVNTLQRITGHGLVVGPPKTARSRRSIALSPEAVNLLHAIRGRQIEQRLAAGDAWQNTGYVFTQANGTPVAPDMISKDFCAIVRTAGLPHLTFHGLRHAHATLLLTAGVHPKVVSERLGHSNIAITMDTYSHVLPGLQEAAALALDERLARGRRPDTN